MSALFLRGASVLALAAAWPSLAAAQDAFTSARGNEVGPDYLSYDEEGYLNQLSYELPLETRQRFLRSDGAFRTTLGSLGGDQFYIQQDLKATYHASEWVTGRAYVRHGVDLDGQYVQLQLLPEAELGSHLAVGVPVILDADKGAIDAGLAVTLRDPDGWFDFLRLSAIYQDLLFNGRSEEFSNSDAITPSFSLELQAQVLLGDLGTLSFQIAEQTRSEIEYEERGAAEEFERLTWSLLHGVEVGDRWKLFTEFGGEYADESSEPLSADPTALDFESTRWSYRGRVELQRRIGDDGCPSRVRAGLQFLYLASHARKVPQPGDSVVERGQFPHNTRRREPTAYLGYRFPLDESASLDFETVVYYGYYTNDYWTPRMTQPYRRDPRSQAKVALLPRWVYSADADITLHLSFELDDPEWGGGGLMARVHF
jgi:hypothetical protein